MKKMAGTAFLWMLACITFSFTFKPGGEGYEVYLDGKLVIQNHGSDMATVKNIQLDESSRNSILTLKYHHCGKVGKNRVIALKDEKGKTLKEWRFPDASVALSPMKCAVKDILGEKGYAVLTLHYSSSELPQGRTIAGVNLRSGTLTGK